MNKKKIIIGFFVLGLLLAGITGGIYLVGQRQEIRKEAAPSTIIYFQPSSVSTQIDQIVNLSISIDTGGNALATVRLDINYDPQVLQALSLTFSTNLPQSLRTIDLSQPGKISGSAGVVPGSSISGANQQVANLSFKVLNGLPSKTTVSFGEETSAYPATQTEPVGSNLVSQKGSATIIVASADQPTATPTPLAIAPTGTPTSASTVTLTPTTTPILPQTGQATPTIIFFFVGAGLLILALPKLIVFK